MRTSINREVERDCFDRVSKRFTTIYIKGSAKETMEQVWDYAINLIAYIEEVSYIAVSAQETGNDNELMISTDAEEYEDYTELKEAYNDFKNGARATVIEPVQEVVADPVQVEETVSNEAATTEPAETVTIEVINNIVELAKGYITLTTYDKDNYDYSQLSKTLKTELEHTLFSWACDILNESEYTKEAIKDTSWIYYKQFSQLYHIIKGR